MEARILGGQISIRSIESGAKVIEGYGAVFNQRSRLIYEQNKLFYEVIREGAFDEVMAGDLNVIANFQHEDEKMLARTKSGTLSLEVDERGLKYIFEVPDTNLGRDIAVQVERGDIFESSFRFAVRPKDVEWKREGEDLVRYVNKITVLNDVALVTNGAYANTDVEVAMREMDAFVAQEEKERREALENKRRSQMAINKNYD